MDYATPVGLLSSLALIMLAIAVGGGHLQAFGHAPSMLIVLGGTVTVLLTSFSLGDLLRTTAITARALTHAQPSFASLAKQLIALAQKNRQTGILSLQKEAAEEPNPFMRQALSLAVDGAPAETIEKILYQDTVSLIDRHERGLAVLRRGADVAPAMGLIGTLIGLIQMLGQLSDPAAIGPAMAIAILTTFYGALMSYVVLTPLASKLERTGADDLLSRKLITTAVISFTRQENPRQLELHLNAILPPTQRISVFK